MELTPDLVARCYREEPDLGPNPNFTPIEEAERQSIAKSLLASAPPGPIWVFAYGSLIWRPEFEVTEVRRATAFGWHRSFCLELTRWRGTPSLPGLMLALQSGGRCNGVGLRLPEDGAPEIIHQLVKREITVSEDAHMARWVTVSTDNGPLKALTFWAGPKGAGILRGLPLETVAWRLAHACGHYGSSAEYLYQTVAKLEEHGIRDRNLWRLQKLVAAEIKSWVPKHS
ncbi:MAG: gamma-glutamylcyclotransferase [Alphaproteobacteria bacterium]|nr:gamma-glutamylcyclotransferase [Alphaproteobacteria bacterium]